MRNHLLPLFRLALVVLLSFIFSNCEQDEVSSDTDEITKQHNRVQINTNNEVSKSAIDFIKTKTNNSFAVTHYKGKVFLSEATSNAKNTNLGTVDTSKEIVVLNETNTKHTFKVIDNDNDSNTYTNLIVVETETTTYEYFIKYTVNEGVTIHDEEGNLDFSQFRGRIETFNSEGDLIGDVLIEDGSISTQTGQFAPCPDEPIDDTTTPNDPPSNDGATSSSSNSAGIDGSDTGSTSSPIDNTENGGWFASSDSDDCGLQWSYAQCGCGGTANGHAPSGPDCCQGSPLTITDCNGNLVTQGRDSNTNTMFKRDPTDPCDDGAVGVILDETIIRSILNCINGLSLSMNDNTTIDPEIAQQNNLTATDWMEISNFLDENYCSEDAQQEVIDNLINEYDDYKILNELEGKALCVYNKLKSTSSGFKNAIKKFDGDFPVAHLKLESTILGGTAKGLTVPPANCTLEINSPDYVITVQVNSSNNQYGHPQRPNLLIAKTIIHEVIHAEMFRKLLSLAKQGHLDFSGQSAEQQTNYMISIRGNFPGVYDYMRRYNNWQHQQMATHYRETIARILQEFSTGNKVPDNEQPLQLYMDLSWEGLIYENGTNAIQSWMQLTQVERDRIESVISNYITNNINETCTE
ncbi:hypothetical protein [Kordia jejudonensis]|uniref:hypothetical protein n=1 Tax=Kordia jejudonensis TaxID=1348245 RepID=UPI00062962A2|nr:hypothetical protein [Kordia jejudonensis]